MNVRFWHKADIRGHQFILYLSRKYSISPIVCAFSQTILLKVINLHIRTLDIGGNYECRQVIQHYNSSYVFSFDLWNNNQSELQYAS